MSGSSIYEVGIHLSAKDGVSGVLASISKSVLGLHGSVEHLQAGFSKLQLGAIGTGFVAAGIGLGHVLDRFEHAGEHLVHAKVMFESALPAATRSADMAKVSAAAWKEAGTNLQSTVSGNVEALHDLFNTVQSVKHSTELLSTFNGLKNVFASAKDGEAVGDAGSGRNVASAIRAIELSGRTTLESIAAISEQYAETTIALRGRVTGGALLTQMSNAGDARYGWSDEFVGKTLPAIIANGLSNRTGSALYAANSNLFGGVSSSLMQGKFQEKFGLHKESDELHDDQGKFKGFKVGSMWEASTWRLDPLKWANEFRDHLRSMGVDIADMATMQNVVGEIGRGNKGLKSALDELLLPNPNRQLNKEVANISNVGADAVDIMKANDPKAIRAALAAQWQSFSEGVGEQLVAPFMTDVIKPLALALRDISQWAHANPETVAAIGKSLMVLSAGLVGLGTALVGGVLLAAIGPVGWLVAGISALAAAFRVFAPKAFDEWLAGFKTMVEGFATLNISKALDGLKGEFLGILHVFPVSISGEIESWPGRVGAAITQFGTDIVEMVKGVFSGLGDKIKGFLTWHMSYDGDSPGDGGFTRTSYETGGAGWTGGGGYGGRSADDVINGARGAGFNTRGVRNMNIGNIGYGPWARAHGAIGSAGTDTGHGVAVFPSFEVGAAATAALALSKYLGGKRSIDALIAGANGWTPGNHAAAANVARMMGISAFADAHLQIPVVMERFKAALAVQELGPAGARYAREHMRGGIHVSPPKRNQSITVQAVLHLDGKKIARHTITAMVDALRGPSRGSQMPDDSRATYGTGSAYSPSFA